MVAPSWLLGAVVLAFLFAPTARNVVADGGFGAVASAVSVAFVLILFGSVLLHELAHAFVARARGHAVRTVVLTAWGGHTSYDARGTTPASQVLIAAAGPLTNGVLAVVFWFAYSAASSSPITDTGGAVVALLLYAGALANGFVGFFNLLPSLPLDGGAILEAVVWRVTGDRRKGTVVGAWLGRALAVGVVAWAVVTPLARGGELDLITVAWAALIASLLWSGASRALAASTQTARIDALDLSALMRPATAADQNSSVAQVLEVATRAGTAYVVLVDFAGTAVGYVETSAAQQVPADRQASTPATAVAVRLAPAPGLQAGRSGPDLLDDVRRASGHAPVLVVAAGSRIVGLVWVTDVVAALSGRSTA